MRRFSASTLFTIAASAHLSAFAVGEARAQTAGVALKSRERAVLMGQDGGRASLLPGGGAAASPQASAPKIDEGDGDFGPVPQSLTVSLSEIASRMNGPQSKLSSGILDFWFEGRFEPYEAGTFQRHIESGTMSVVSVGSSYKIGPDIMIGALASLDQGSLEEMQTRSDVTTSGWVAGPFASVKFGGGVVFDGRIGWGDGSFEERQPGRAVYGEYARTLMKGRLRGTREVAGWSLTPMVGVTFIEEMPRVAAREKLSDAPPAHEGRIEFTPEVKKRVAVSSYMFVEPSFAAGAFLPIDDQHQLAAALPSAGSVQLKAEAGMALGVTDGVSVKAKGGIETTGQSTPDVWSGRLQLDMPLGK